MYDDAYNMDRDEQLSALINAGKLAQAIEFLDAWYAGEPWNGDVLMRLAVVHWLAGEPARTLHDLDAYLAMNPNDAEALSRRAQALLMLGKREDAEVSLAKAETIDATTPGVLLNRALIYEEYGEYQQAIIALSAYLEKIPSDHLALARRSHLHRQVGNYRQALIDAQASVVMHPEDPETHFADALAHVTLEQGEEALAACDHCLQAQAAFLPALRLKIDLLADLGRLGEADTNLAQLQALEPEAPQTTLLRARIATEHEDFGAALQWMERYLDDAPDDAHGYYRRGMVYFRMGDYPHAVEDLLEYLHIAPTAIEGYEQLFLCHLELGQLAEAVAVGIRAVELQPENYRLHYNLAFAYFLTGKSEEAFEGFRRAMQLAPDNEELVLRIYLAFIERGTLPMRLTFLRDTVQQSAHPLPLLRGLLAETWLESGQPDEALSLAREIIDEVRERSFGYLLAIKALCMLNRYSEALAFADSGVRILPNDSQLRVARAMVLRDSERPNEALEELANADRLMPGDPEIMRQRALVFGSVGQLSEATHLLREALLIDDSNADGHFWLGFFELHRKGYREALAESDHLLALNPSSMEGHTIRGAALRGLHRHAEAEAELLLVLQQDPALLTRLCADPILAKLIANGEGKTLSDRVRQSVARYLSRLNHLKRNASS